MVERENILESRAKQTDGELGDAYDQLAEILALIQVVDQEIKDCGDRDALYAERFGLVTMAMATAWLCNYASGYRIDPDNEEWPVAYIELPSGQVSWHMPQHKEPWDSHSTEEKYRRVEQFVQSRGFEVDP